MTQAHSTLGFLAPVASTVSRVKKKGGAWSTDDKHGGVKWFSWVWGRDFELTSAKARMAVFLSRVLEFMASLCIQQLDAQ